MDDVNARKKNKQQDGVSEKSQSLAQQEGTVATCGCLATVQIIEHLAWFPHKSTMSQIFCRFLACRAEYTTAVEDDAGTYTGSA